jgi:hypothetical protein
MYENERAKIRADIEAIKAESVLVESKPASKYDKLREEMKEIKKSGKKNKPIQEPVQVNEEETKAEATETKADPESEKRNRVVGANGTIIEEDGNDVIYTFPDDDEDEPKEEAKAVEEDPDQIAQQQDYSINNGNSNPSPAEQDQEGFKSEIAKQLFDVPRKKILQRTELPRRMILPMSMQKTAIYLATQRYTKDCETGPEHWMYEYGYLMLSAGRKVRMEGMAAFQPVAEGGSSENINF